jgi:hypothetical protein
LDGGIYESVHDHGILLLRRSLQGLYGGIEVEWIYGSLDKRWRIQVKLETYFNHFVRRQERQVSLFQVIISWVRHLY